MSVSAQNGKSAPANRVPIAMAFVSIGMVLTVCGITQSGFVGHSAQTASDVHHFLRGACYGLGISFEIAGLIIAITAATARQKKL